MRFEKVSKETYKSFMAKNEKRISPSILLEKLQLPSRSTAKSSGYDFYLPFDCVIKAYSTALIPTFIKMQLDDDKVLEVYPRSSYGIKKGIMLANTVGIIDADYYNNPDNEGHIMICLRNMTDEDIHLVRGDKFCQGIIKQYFLIEGDNYGVGNDRAGGIGSTGN